MKKEKMFEALGGIDQKYLEEAYHYRKRKSSGAVILKILIPVAAMFSLIAVLMLTVLPAVLPNNPENASQGESFPPLSMGSPTDKPLNCLWENLVYEVREDHAVIKQFYGSSTAVTIPDKINNLPVTEVELFPVENNPNTLTTVYLDNSNLTYIALPDDCGIELNLGKNVTEISPELLRNKGITSVTVNRDNPSYSAFEGILYSKDMKTLVACPEGLSAKALVPGKASSGKKEVLSLSLETETIKSNAFAGCGIESITLPPKVKNIEEMAFANCAKLCSLSLPTSLTTAAQNLAAGCDALAYLLIDQPEESVAFTVDLPIDTKVFYKLPQSSNLQLEEELVMLYEQAEECVSWFTRYNTISFDSGYSKDGYFLVNYNGITTLEQLKEYLQQFFTPEIADLIFAENMPEDTPEDCYFREIDGELFTKPKRYLALKYDSDRAYRNYSVVQDESGVITMTMRTIVPQVTTAIYLEFEYTVIETDDGYLFDSSFQLPVYTWFPYYLLATES